MAVFLNVQEVVPRREFQYIWILKIYLLLVVYTSELMRKRFNTCLHRSSYMTLNEMVIHTVVFLVDTT
jgi:hypothetical protein